MFKYKFFTVESVYSLGKKWFVHVGFNDDHESVVVFSSRRYVTGDYLEYKYSYIWDKYIIKS